MSDRSDGSWSFGRRTALRLTGGVALGCASTGTAVAGERTRTERTCYVKQGGTAYEIEPLSGDVPVEELYDYRLPDEYEGVGVTSNEGPHYRSVGTKTLQEEATTVTFLYDGPDGLSLVVVHGRPGGEGGSVSWTIERVPKGAEWAVKDDLYVDADTGERGSNNYDLWQTDGSDHHVDWTWGSHGTDGGALSDLGETFSLTIYPWFNENAELYGDHYSGRVEDWRILSGDLDDPDTASLDLDEPVTVACETNNQKRSWKRTWVDHEDWDEKKRHDDETHRRDDDGERRRDDGEHRGDEKKRRGDHGKHRGRGRKRRGGKKRHSGDEKNRRDDDQQKRRGGGKRDGEARRDSQTRERKPSGSGRTESQSEKQGLLKTILGGDD